MAKRIRKSRQSGAKKWLDRLARLEKAGGQEAVKEAATKIAAYVGGLQKAFLAEHVDTGHSLRTAETTANSGSKSGSVTVAFENEPRRPHRPHLHYVKGYPTRRVITKHTRAKVRSIIGYVVRRWAKRAGGAQ